MTRRNNERKRGALGPHLGNFRAAERETIKSETPEMKVMDDKTQLHDAAGKFHFTRRTERHPRRLLVPSWAPMQVW